jgi:hypothetical protein
MKVKCAQDTRNAEGIGDVTQKKDKAGGLGLLEVKQAVESPLEEIRNRKLSAGEIGR